MSTYYTCQECCERYEKHENHVCLGSDKARISDLEERVEVLESEAEEREARLVALERHVEQLLRDADTIPPEPSTD